MYLGMSLPADWRAFAASSPWRTPIAPGARVDPNSGAMMARLKSWLQGENRILRLQTESEKYTAPVHVVSAGTPLVTIVSDSDLPVYMDPDRNRTALVPITAEMWADPSNDSHVVIIMESTAFEFWHFRREGSGYRCGMGGLWNLDGPGYNPSPMPNGANAARLPYIGGLARGEEALSGRIEHALNMVAPTTGTGYRWPATASDGRVWGKSGIPEGARVQLDPAFPLTALLPATRIIARCLQVYGAIVMDSAAGWNVKLQNYGAGAKNPWAAHPFDFEHIPFEAYRVLA